MVCNRKCFFFNSDGCRYNQREQTIDTNIMFVWRNCIYMLLVKWNEWHVSVQWNSYEKRFFRDRWICIYRFIFIRSLKLLMHSCTHHQHKNTHTPGHIKRIHFLFKYRFYFHSVPLFRGLLPPYPPSPGRSLSLSSGSLFCSVYFQIKVYVTYKFILHAYNQSVYIGCVACYSICCQSHLSHCDGIHIFVFGFENNTHSQIDVLFEWKCESSGWARKKTKPHTYTMHARSKGIEVISSNFHALIKIQLYIKKQEWKSV